MQGFEKMVVWSDKQVSNGITSWLWSQVPVRNEKTTVSLSSMFKSCGTSLFARARVTSPQIHLGSGKPTPTRRSGMKFRRGVEGGGGQDDWKWSEKTTGYWDVIQSADYPNKLKQRENTNTETMYHQQQHVIFRRIHHLYSVFHLNPCCLSLQPNRWSEPTASLLGRILLLDIWHTNLPDEETMLWSEELAAQRLWRQKPDNISWSPVKTDLSQQDLRQFTALRWYFCTYIIR